MKCIEFNYIMLYKEYRIEDCDIEPQPLLDSAFAKMLFDSEPSISAKNKIKMFFKYLIEKDMINDVNIYNNMDLEYEELKQNNLPEDEEIQYKTKIIDIPADVSYEENVLFSMVTDIDEDTFMMIVANKTLS